MALKQNSANVENTLMSSLVIGFICFIYCKIAAMIPITISYNVDNVCIVISALLFGYVFGRIIKNKKIIEILDFLQIRDTGNKYYWDDILDNQYPMKIKISYDDFIYEGMLHNYESYSNEPHIVLASYMIMDKKNNILCDFRNVDTKIIILDTSKANKTEVIYSTHSEICKDIKHLCESNRILYSKNKEK